MDNQPHRSRVRDAKASLQALLFDLDASHRGIRLASIMQLQHFLQSAEVVAAFQERLRNEDDEECRFHLETVLRREGARHFKLTLSRGSDTDSVAAFVGQFLAATPRDQAELLKGLAARRDLDPGKTLAAVIEGWRGVLPPSEVLLALLSLPETLFSSAPAQTFLAACLRHSQPIVLQRALQILSRVAPVQCVHFLPHLLLHASVAVRAMAIFALARIHPAEARRLLGEFIASPDPVTRGIGMSLLFGFPFDHIAPILLDLLENNGIPSPSVDLVKALVKSNPDSRFLERLASLAARRGGEVPLAEELLSEVAEGLKLAGLQTGSVESIRAQALNRAQAQLRNLLPPVPEEPVPVSPAPPAPAEPSPPATTSALPGVAAPPGPSSPGRVTGELPPPADAPTKPEGTDPASRLRHIHALSTLDPATQAGLEGMVRESRQEEEQLLLVDIVRRHRLREEKLARALAGLLEHGSDRLKLAIINALSDTAPRVLLPHLGVLAFSPATVVASLAIRKLRQIEGGGFLRRMNEWTADPHPVRKRAVIIALTQMDFPQAKTFVLAQLKKTRDLKSIESFGNVLLMNPDAATLRELNAIADWETGDKRQALLKLVEMGRAGLARIAPPDEGEGWQAGALAMIREMKLEDTAFRALEQIRTIHYRIGATDFLGIFPPDSGPVIGAILFLLLALPLAFRLGCPTDPGVLRSETGKVAPTVTIHVPKEVQLLQEGAVLAGTLEEYDPFNHHWKIRGVDGSLIKVQFAAGGAPVSRGQRLLLTLSPRGKTRAGYPLYRVREFRPASGK